MAHKTSFEVIQLLENVRNFLFGVASVGVEHQRKQAKLLINEIDDLIGGRP